MDKAIESTSSERETSRRTRATRGSAWRYFARRTLALGLTVVITVYLTILVVNLGGYLDEIIKGEITFSVAMRAKGGWLADLPTEERLAQQQAAMGLA